MRTLKPAERLSYSAALQRHAGVDAFSSSDAELLDARHAMGSSAKRNLTAVPNSIC